MLQFNGMLRNTVIILFYCSVDALQCCLLFKDSRITFTGSIAVNFYNNMVSMSGGAISTLDCNIWFTGGSTVYFNSNLASYRLNGGTMHIYRLQ